MKLIVALLFVFLILINLYGTKNSRQLKRSVDAGFAIMFLLSVFKDGSQMPDHQVYSDAYNLGINGESLSSLEISYYYLTRIFGTFGIAGFNLLLGFYSTIFLLCFRKLFLYYQHNAPLAILIFYSNAFLVFGLIQIRYGAAIALIYYIVLFQRNKFNRFLLWISAFLLHASSIVFLPLVLLRKKNIKNRTILFSIFLAFCVTPLIVPLIKYIVEILPINYLQQKLFTYLIEERTQNLKLNFLGPNFILRAFFFLIFIKYSRFFNFSKDRILFYFYCIGFFTYIILSSIPEIAFRIANGLFIAEVFLLSILASKIKPKRVRFFVVVLYSGIQLSLNLFLTNYFNYSIS